MGRKTKIDWCDSTWNPVTGCLHGCEYCYARKQAERFGGFDHDENKEPVGTQLAIGVQKLENPKYIMRRNGLQKAPYPWFFAPTFHRYLLDEPQHWKKPRTIFVCSMADLFGAWVPDEWIQAVFEACRKAPQHRYLFLTKNPKRYNQLAGNLDWYEDYFTRGNFWFGTTVEHPDLNMEFGSPYVNSFISVEPILSAPDETNERFELRSKWIIIGAEAGNRKNKVVPEREWIDRIVRKCDGYGAPVFMKESLREIMGDAFRQEFPWEV